MAILAQYAMAMGIACAKSRGKQFWAPELSPFSVTSRTLNFMRTLRLFYDWLFYVIAVDQPVYISFYWLFYIFTCWDFGGWGDCSQPWTRSTLQYRARCDKHSVLNPPWLIAINSLSPSWAFAISANAYTPVQRCDRGTIPCVMNAKQRGSQPWRVSNSSASYGHRCVLLVVKHRLWTPSQPKLPLLPSLREMGSHLLMSSPPIVKRHPHNVTRPHIVKRHPFNLLIYTASSIVVMVDREMEIW